MIATVGLDSISIFLSIFFEQKHVYATLVNIDCFTKLIILDHH